MTKADLENVLTVLKDLVQEADEPVSIQRRIGNLLVKLKYDIDRRPNGLLFTLRIRVLRGRYGV